MNKLVLIKITSKEELDDVINILASHGFSIAHLILSNIWNGKTLYVRIGELNEERMGIIGYNYSLSVYRDYKFNVCTFGYFKKHIYKCLNQVLSKDIDEP